VNSSPCFCDLPSRPCLAVFFPAPQSHKLPSTFTRRTGEQFPRSSWEQRFSSFGKFPPRQTVPPPPQAPLPPPLLFVRVKLPIVSHPPWLILGFFPPTANGNPPLSKKCRTATRSSFFPLPPFPNPKSAPAQPLSPYIESHSQIDQTSLSPSGMRVQCTSFLPPLVDEGSLRSLSFHENACGSPTILVTTPCSSTRACYGSCVDRRNGTPM